MALALSTFTGRVTDDGRLVLDRPKAYGAQQVRLRGKAILLTLKIRPTRRSLDQNAWLWGVAYRVLGETWGYDRHEVESMHYGLLMKCFGSRLDRRLGVEVPNVPASKELDTKTFSEFMQWLVRYAAAEGIVIPLPNEVEYADMA